MLGQSSAVRVEARRDVRRLGETPKPFVLRSGWAAQYHDSPDGRRQITGIMVSGERWAGRSMHGIASITACEIDYSHDPSDWSPSDLDDVKIVKSWLLNVGRPSSLRRVAWLLMYLMNKPSLRTSKLNNAFELALTQDDIANICCITAVHVNRMFRELYRAQIVRRDGRHIVIAKNEELLALAAI